MRGIDPKLIDEMLNFNNANNDSRFYVQELNNTHGNKSVRVTVPYDFFISQTYVTNGEFEEFVKETKYKTFVERYKTGYYVDTNMKWTQGVMNSWNKTHWEIEPDLPVVQISFVDAMAYCSWLSSKLKVNVRLPTLEEWELAARDSKNQNSAVMFPWGNSMENIDRKINCIDTSASEFCWRHDQIEDGYKFVSPVRAFPPNDKGVFDPIDNVWTWLYSTSESVDTAHSKDYIASPRCMYICIHNPPIEMKGGCFYSRISHCNLLSRMCHPATDGSIDVGFRVVIVPEKFSALEQGNNSYFNENNISSYTTDLNRIVEVEV